MYRKLRTYSESNYYPFHMPGHKRNIIGLGNASPFCYDISEIDGWDDLHHAAGILRDGMTEAALLYGTEKTYFLVNGSTCGILSAISAVTADGDKIILARNCHKSVYHGIQLKGLRPVYIYPTNLETFDISGGISIEAVKEVLREHADAKAVIVTSPTYEGIVSDIKQIAEVVHSYGMPLIVDEAHGAHFGMIKDNPFPLSALNLDADIVIQSLHKTMPALTQTALLHINKDSTLVCSENIERYLSIYQTSSPSYVLMASIDECIKFTSEKGPYAFRSYYEMLQALRERIGKLRHMRLVDRALIGTSHIYDVDEGKLVISVKHTDMNGIQLYEKLLNKYQLQTEMAAGSYVIAMTSVMDTQKGYRRLADALEEIDKSIENVPWERGYIDWGSSFRNDYVCSPAEAVEKVQREKYAARNLSCAAGEVSGEYVYLYPPGIPIIVPGERISGEAIELIMNYRQSDIRVHGLRDCSAETVRVLC